MRSGYHLQVISVIELLSDVLAEGVTRPSRVHSPACTVVRVGPEQVAHRPLVRHLLESLKRANIVQSLD